MGSTNQQTYRALFAVPGFRRLCAASLLTRTGASMQALILVLFVLHRFGSPQLAGVTVFLSVVPGLLLSPLAGALLDRYRRMLLINADYAIAALSLVAIGALNASGHLPVGLLLGIVAVSSLTNPLSNSGTRSLFPIMVPSPLWERANAVDSGGYVVASIAGPAVAGLLVGVAAVEVALLANAALYLAGASVLLAMREPELERATTTSLRRDALAGLGYFFRNRELRGLALVTSISNISFGILSVGMPVWLLSHLHTGDGSVGVMYAVTGVTGLCAGLVAGRLSSEGREARFVVAGCVLTALSMLAMLGGVAIGGGILVVALAMALFGLGNGPFDIGMFSLRQRATAPVWMGRAFAISMSLNFLGMPIGSALGGQIVARSVPAAFAVAVLVNVLATAVAVLMLRPGVRGPDGVAAALGTIAVRQPDS
ncbi:MAG: MFS transporter [Candidatus Dormibacteraeota bacterium]|nr:MFS transporter [Candidatus Dormibacteraeota bacterium]